MARNLATMTPEERRSHTILTSIVNNDVMSAAEQNSARLKLDALEWKGQNGAVYQEIHDLKTRLESVESERGDGRAVPAKKYEELKAYIQDVDSRFQQFAQAAAERHSEYLVDRESIVRTLVETVTTAAKEAVNRYVGERLAHLEVKDGDDV